MNTKPRPAPSPAGSFMHLRAHQERRLHVHAERRTTATTVLAVLILLATIEPELKDAGFAVSMAILGVGMGLIASQLGNVVQSSVDASGRGEAGGLQYTGQQLGSSLGVALIGAIVLTGLTGAFLTTIQSDQRISAEVSAQVGVAV